MKIFVYASESGTYALTKGCQIRVENKHENLCSFKMGSQGHSLQGVQRYFSSDGDDQNKKQKADWIYH